MKSTGTLPARYKTRFEAFHRLEHQALTQMEGGLRRVEYYRIWLRIAGGDAAWESVSTSADLACLIENAPANAQLEVAISALNNGGESVRSASVTVITA